MIQENTYNTTHIYIQDRSKKKKDIHFQLIQERVNAGHCEDKSLYKYFNCSKLQPFQRRNPIIILK